jgi:hypothetical protein
MHHHFGSGITFSGFFFDTFTSSRLVCGHLSRFFTISSFAVWLKEKHKSNRPKRQSPPEKRAVPGHLR